jgi:transposase
MTLGQQAGRNGTLIMKRGRSNRDKIVVSSNTKTKPPKERPVNETKYIGMDVHMATTVIAVLNSVGKVVAEAIIETKASTILDFLKSQRGTVYVTFEEGAQAAWLYDLIRPHVAQVVVCNPRKITGQDNKADKADAKRLAELLRTNGLKAIYHGEHSTRAVKELAHSYGSIVSDGTRVKNRLKALFRGRGIACSGTGVYSKEEREQWLKRLDNAALRVRTCRLWKELDLLAELREEAEKDLMAEARKHADIKILRSIPGIGPLRAAVILSFTITPHRFRTKKQFWNYCGLAVMSKVTSEYALIEGRVCRSTKRPLVRGLNRNYNRALKEAFKGAAATAAMGPWKSHFDAMVANGTRAPLALLTLARKISSITLALWKKGERYNDKKLKFMHAV